MKSGKLKGSVYLALAVILLFCTGSAYRAEGFGGGFTVLFCLSVCAVSPLFLAAYRRLGTFMIWGALFVSAVLLYLVAQDAATAILVWTLCCGTALAVSVFWPALRKIRPMAKYALPAAGMVWLVGTLVYCKLHFGRWHLSFIPHRIGQRYYHLLEDSISGLYTDAIPDYANALLQSLKELELYIGFAVVLLTAYALFGIFFLSVFLADRSAGRGNRWLGGWHTLIPTRGISLVYMGLHFLGLFINDDALRTLSATLNLFGFFYVFTAFYRLHLWLRTKEVHRYLRRGLIGLLFCLAYFSVGGSLLSVYTISMYVGWWFATTPKLKNGKRNSL